MARHPRLAALAPLALVLFACPSALAWAPIDSDQPRWQGFPVLYLVNQASLPSSIASIGVARVDAGFASWAAPDCTSFKAMNAGDTKLSDNYKDNQNVIRWESQSWKQSYGPVDSVIGVTAPVWQQGSSKIVDADIVFNNVGFKWNDTGSGNFVDTQSIATHEQGHFLGLGHSSVKSATMYPSYSGGSALRVLSQDDISGVCALYPSGTTTGTTTSTATSTGGQSCQNCVASSQQSGGACSAAASACGNEPACVALNKCLNTCSTPSCADACEAKSPGGVAAYDAFVTCACQACASPCANECGTGTSTGTTTSSPTGAGGTTATGTHGVGGAATGAGGASLDDDDDLGFAQPLSESGAGCGCIVGPSPSGPGARALAVLAGLVTLLRRRRRA